MNYSYQSKQIVTNALLQLVKVAPKLQVYPNNMENQNNDISEEQFKIWLDYVISVLDITYEYAKENIFLFEKTKIIQIASQNHISHIHRISQIVDEIISLACETLK